MGSEKRKILLVDDEDDICLFLKANLEKKGDYEVASATSGKEGIQVAKRFKPHLILLDLMMPGVSGTDVATTLNEDPVTAEIPIVFITALAEGTGLDIPGREIMAKPVDTDQVIAKIEEVLG